MGKHHDAGDFAASAVLRRSEGVAKDLEAKVAQRQAEGASPMEMGVLQHALRMALQKVERLKAKQGSSAS